MRRIPTLEEAIGIFEQLSKLYETNRMYVSQKLYKQLTAWLRELQERRKAPEIVRCGECKHLRRWINTNYQFCDITACKVSEDEFCNRAERRIDND